MLANETLLTIAEATRRFPGHRHVSSTWRSCRKGVLAANGERVYLEHVRFGGRIYTSAEAIMRFGHALASADAKHFGQAETPRGSGPHYRAVEDRQKQISTASKALDQAGL